MLQCWKCSILYEPLQGYEAPLYTACPHVINGDAVVLERGGPQGIDSLYCKTCAVVLEKEIYASGEGSEKEIKVDAGLVRPVCKFDWDILRKQHNGPALKAVDYTQKPTAPLPTFNVEQLMEQEPGDFLISCAHLRESRMNPDVDFYGYLEKYEVETPDGTVIAFIKQCHECAMRPVSGVVVVARVAYESLSESTMKAVLKNTGSQRVEPTSDRGRQLLREVEAEGPDTIN